MTYTDAKDLKPTNATMVKVTAATRATEKEERPRSGLVSRKLTPVDLAVLA
jgi:hypothetical protein